ncbi:MAG: peptidylprolyl isomerase [Synechococcaceae cyanobacterium]|jgi:peptidyl-prolyl cis-trans isomerase B (cyclophilin B)
MKPPLWRQLIWAPLLLLALALPLGLVACAADRGAQPLGCAAGTIPCLSGTAVVALDTSRGQVLLRLDGKNAPLTAGNFVDLVRRGVYDGTVFHRVVREPVPFVVQGGDPASANPRVPASQYGSGNFIDPSSGEARLIPLELKRQKEAEPQYGRELTTPVITKELALSHQRGSLAMARTQDPNSASAQFYIALEALPELDGRYAVFGQVIQGMEVVDAIRQGDKLVKARLVEGGKLVKGQP